MESSGSLRSKLLLAREEMSKLKQASKNIGQMQQSRNKLVDISNSKTNFKRRSENEKEVTFEKDILLGKSMEETKAKLREANEKWRKERKSRLDLEKDYLSLKVYTEKNNKSQLSNVIQVKQKENIMLMKRCELLDRDNRKLKDQANRCKAIAKRSSFLETKLELTQQDMIEKENDIRLLREKETRNEKEMRRQLEEIGIIKRKLSASVSEAQAAFERSDAYESALESAKAELLALKHSTSMKEQNTTNLTEKLSREVKRLSYELEKEKKESKRYSALANETKARVSSLEQECLRLEENCNGHLSEIERLRLVITMNNQEIMNAHENGAKLEKEIRNKVNDLQKKHREQEKLIQQVDDLQNKLKTAKLECEKKDSILAKSNHEIVNMILLLRLQINKSHSICSGDDAAKSYDELMTNKVQENTHILEKGCQDLVKVNSDALSELDNTIDLAQGKQAEIEMLIDQLKRSEQKLVLSNQHIDTLKNTLETEREESRTQQKLSQERLETRMRDHGEEIEKMKEKIDLQKLELEQKACQIRQMNEDFSNKERELTEKTKETDSLIKSFEAQKQKLQEEYSEKILQFEEVLTQRENHFEQVLQTLKEKVKAKAREMETLTLSLSDEKCLRQDLEVEMEKLKKDLRMREISHRRFEEEKTLHEDALRKHSKDLETQLESLKTSYEGEKKILETKIQSQTEDIQALKEEKIVLVNQIQENEVQQKKLEELKSKYEQINHEYCEQVKDSNNELQNKNEALLKASSDIESLNEEIKSLKYLLDKKQQAYSDKLNALREERARHQAKIIELEEYVDDMKADKLSRDNVTEKQMTQANAQIVSITTEREKLQSQVVNMQNQLNCMGAEKCELLSEIESLKKELNHSKISIEQLNRVIGSFDDKFQANEQRIKSLEDENSSKKILCVDYKNRMEAMLSKAKTLQEKWQAQKSSNVQLELKIAGLLKENILLKATAEELEADMKMKASQHDETIKTMKSEFQQSLEDLMQELDSQKVEYSKLKCLKNENDKISEKHSLELQRVKKMHQSKIETLQVTFERFLVENTENLFKKIKGMETQAATDAITISELTKKIEDAETDLNKSKNTLFGLNEEIKNLKGQNESIKAELQIALATSSGFSAASYALEKQNQELIATKAFLANELRNHNTLVSDVTAKLEACEQKLSIQSKQISDVNAQNGVLKKKLDTIQNQQSQNNKSHSGFPSVAVSKDRERCEIYTKAAHLDESRFEGKYAEAIEPGSDILMLKRNHQEKVERMMIGFETYMTKVVNGFMSKARHQDKMIKKLVFRIFRSNALAYNLDELLRTLSLNYLECREKLLRRKYQSDSAIQDLQQEIIKLKSHCFESNEELKNERRISKELKQDLTISEALVDDLKIDSASYKKKLENCSFEYNKLRQKLEEVENDKVSIRKELLCKNDLVNCLQNEQTDYKLNAERIMERCETLQETLKSIQCENMELRGELKTSSNLLKEQVHLANKAKELEQLRTSVNAMQQSNRVLQAESDNKEKELERLKDEIKEKNGTIRNQSYQLQRIEDENVHLKVELEEKNDTIQKQSYTIKQNEDERIQLLESIKHMENEKVHLLETNEELNNLKDINKEKIALIECQSNQIKNLETERLRLEQTSKELNNLKDTIEGKNVLVEKLSCEIQQIEKEKIRLVEPIKQIEEDKIHLLESNRLAEQSLLSECQLNEKLETEVSMLRQKVDNNKFLEEDIKRKQGLINSLSKSNKDQREKLRLLTVNRNILKIFMVLIISSSKALNVCLKQERENASQSNVLLSKRVLEQQQKLRIAKTQYSNLKSEHDLLKAEAIITTEQTTDFLQKSLRLIAPKLAEIEHKKKVLDDREKALHVEFDQLEKQQKQCQLAETELFDRARKLKQQEKECLSLKETLEQMHEGTKNQKTATGELQALTAELRIQKKNYEVLQNEYQQSLARIKISDKKNEIISSEDFEEIKEIAAEGTLMIAVLLEEKKKLISLVKRLQ